jgi:hypothetical protein
VQLTHRQVWERRFYPAGTFLDQTGDDDRDTITLLHEYAWDLDPTIRTASTSSSNASASSESLNNATRRTPAKLAKSPYRHLLKPKAGGIALVLAAMGDYLTEVLDVTLLYPDNPGKNLIGQLLQGKIKRIVVRVRRLPVPPNTAGRDYQEDAEFQAQIQNWVNTLWEEKDALIETLEQTLKRPAPAAVPAE